MTDDTLDAIRTARLVLDFEVQAGEVSVRGIEEFVRAGAFGDRPPSPAATRIVERLAMKAGLKDGMSSTVGDSVSLRRALLGAADDSAPRFLVRVDEFPYSAACYEPQRYGVAASEGFHDVMVEAGLPYLLAVLPRPADAYLDPEAVVSRELADDEVVLLERMRRDGVVFGQHGATHRTRFRSPRRHSELGGLDEASVGALLDDARGRLRALGVEPQVLVPPFNRFDVNQWPSLARRYRVITGGPESVRIVGAKAAPRWWGDAVYLPCYPPLYGDATTILRSLDRVSEVAAGCWVPVVLHTAWEIDEGLTALRELASRLVPLAVSWTTFLDAVERSALATG